MSERHEEIAQQVLSELEDCKQAIQELNDEEIMEVSGGVSFSGAVKGWQYAKFYNGGTALTLKSAARGLVKSDDSTLKYVTERNFKGSKS